VILMSNLKAIRIILSVEADGSFYEYTGRLTKTLILALCRDLRIFHGVKGIVSPIHISPLFTMGRRELELGEPVTPQYIRKDNELILKPIKLEGEYIVHVGGEAGLVEKIRVSLGKINGKLMLKFHDNIVSFTLEKIEDYTNNIMEKHLESDRVTLYLKAPSLIYNIYTPSRLPKFTPTAIEVLMTPYMLSKGILTLTPETVLEAGKILGLLVETYYSLKTLKPIMIPFKEKREAALTGKITYIIDTKDKNKKKQIEKILQTTEITGIGESRLNGFGTTTWTQKTNI
jgi:hypothetical protein